MEQKSAGAAAPTAVKLRKFAHQLAEGVTLNKPIARASLTDSFPFTLNTASIEEGARTPLHSHDEHEVWVITRGSGQLGHGGEQLEVTEGDILYFTPGTTHELVNGGSTPLEFVSVYWD